MISGALGFMSTDYIYADSTDTATESEDITSNQNAESNLIYNFKDAKKEGTITFVNYSAIE